MENIKKQRKAERLIHPIPPLVSAGSRALILGSFPSPKSREQGFFYGHPQNRFWRVIASLFAAPVPESIEEKRALILDHGLALWDVIASCDIEGASDASIKRALPNDIGALLSSYHIERIYCNGKTASGLYDKLILPSVGVPAAPLPSTSPANASWSLERLIEAWRVIL